MKRTIFGKAVIIMGVLACLFGCHKAEESQSVDIAENEVIFSYYSESYVLEGAANIQNIIVSKKESGYLVTITNQEDSNSEVTKKEYQVDQSYIDNVYKILDENNITTWDNLKNYDCLDGRFYSFSYYRNGNTYKLTSDRMPNDGSIIIGQLKNTLLQGLE